MLNHAEPPQGFRLCPGSRAIRAETEISCERFHTLLRQAASLYEQLVTAEVQFQHISGPKFKRSVTERISIPSVLVVDDNARWRDTMCSMLMTYADCRLLHEAEDEIEAVRRASELKPR